MRRREFITLVGGAAAAWPLAARAQQQTLPIVGFLHPSRPEAAGNQHLAEAFEGGLEQSGYIKGQNVVLEYRWANDEYDQLPVLAAELVRRPASIIATVAPVATLAAKQLTATIPIVFSVGSDPVKDGFVGSLGHPGGNLTGVTFFANLLDARRLDLLHLLVPKAKTVAVLVNPKNVEAELQRDPAQRAAQALGLETVMLQANTAKDIEDAFVSLTERHADALHVAADAFLSSQVGLIVRLAMYQTLPTSFTFRFQAEAGALMSYGISNTESLRLAGNYVGRILKGEKAADLPVQQPTKFEFIINQKTAKALGLTIPESLLLLADEVIE